MAQIFSEKKSDGRICVQWQLSFFSQLNELANAGLKSRCWLIPVLESAKPSRVVFWIQVDASGPNFPGEKDIHVLKIIKDSKNASHGSPPKKKMAKHVVFGWFGPLSLFVFDSKHFFGTKAAAVCFKAPVVRRAGLAVYTGHSVLTEVRFSSQSPTTRTFSRFSLSQKRVIDHKLFAITFLQKYWHEKKSLKYTMIYIPKLKFSYLTFPHDLIFFVGVSSFITATVLFGDCNIQSPATLGSKDCNGKVKLPWLLKGSSKKSQSMSFEVVTLPETNSKRTWK